MVAEELGRQVRGRVDWVDVKACRQVKRRYVEWLIYMLRYVIG